MTFKSQVLVQSGGMFSNSVVRVLMCEEKETVQPFAQGTGLRSSAAPLDSLHGCLLMSSRLGWLKVQKYMKTFCCLCCSCLYACCVGVGIHWKYA